MSVVTLAELELGVLRAGTESRALRLRTLSRVRTLEHHPITVDVASSWATLVAALRDVGRRAPANDAWIAATAIVQGLPVVTQDSDYDGIPGLAVIRI